MSKNIESENLLEQVLEYIGTRGFQAFSAGELAPGVIAIYDSYREVDIYFDEAKWKFANPKLWIRPKDDHSPGSCTKPFDGVGLLQGINSRPQVRTLQAALEFAKSNLKTDGSGIFHLIIPFHKPCVGKI